MTYPELAATVLTSVAVLVTVLGVFIAILTVWGYSQFKDIARAAAVKRVEEQIAGGKLRKEIEEIVTVHVTKSISQGDLRSLLEQRVDRLIYSGAEKRSIEKYIAERPDENKEYGE